MSHLKKFLATLFICLSVVSGGAQISNATTSHRHHHVVVMNRVLVTPPQWRQTGGSFPDASDPTGHLPAIEQRTLECIRYHESRDHRIDGDIYTGEGWYQFNQATWNSAAIALHLPVWNSTWSPNQASGDMQSTVAVWYWDRNKRFGVQWGGDSAYCPGVFYF
jgi:hypothetical protein